jgi:hypothetical protein
VMKLRHINQTLARSLCVMMCVCITGVFGPTLIS